MIKLYTHNSYGWVITDDKRNTYNPVDDSLEADKNAVEANASEIIVDYVSNGFKIRNTNNAVNGSAYGYIYLAFAESPFKYSNGR